MAEFPDVFADGLQLSVGPFGITMTLLLSEPTNESGLNVSVPSNIVARIRVSRELASVIADSLKQSLSNPPPPVTVTQGLVPDEGVTG